MVFNKERAYKVMRDNDIDALILSNPENVTYVSGFPPLLKCTYERRLCVIIPLEGSGTIILRTSFIGLHNSANSWIEDIRVYGDSGIIIPPGLNENNLSFTERNIADALAKEGRTYVDVVIDVLREKGLTKAFLGFDKCAYDCIGEEVSKKLPKAKVDLASKIVENIRLVKTEKEIELLKKAASINERGIKAILDEIAVGKTEIELENVYNSKIREEGAEPHFSNILGGSRGALVNDFPSNYTLKRGDPVRIDVDCIYNYYFSDIARSAVLGKSNEHFKKYYNALYIGLERAKEIIKPGIEPCAILETAINSVRKAGIPNYKRFMIGHALGLDCYDGLLISSAENRLLEENMVFSLELMYYELGLGCPHLEDTILVTNTGFKSLQTLGMELYEI